MLRLGIIGWGYWGRNYAKYLDNTIDATLEWVCDIRAEMLSDAVRRYPHLKTTRNALDLIKKKLDGVIIATQAIYHFELGKLFIEHQIPVLIEKPLVVSISQANKLLNLAKKHNAKGLVGHTFYYNQAVRWIKDKLGKKYLGNIYFLEFERQSYGPIRDDVNIVWDFAPHDLSMTSLFLNNKFPLNIYARGKRYSRNEQEDIAVITLEYPNNILVNINVAWLYPIKIRKLVMLGSKRMIVFEDTNSIEPIKVYNTRLKYPSERDPYGAAFRLGDVIIPRIDPIDPLYTEMKHFVNYIKGVEKPIAPIEDGVNNVFLLAAVNYSLKTGKEVNFKEWLKKNS